jgi:hypothetical protein
MNKKRFKSRLIFTLLIVCAGVPTTFSAHHLTVGEVLEMLNRNEVRAHTGIHEAKVDPKLKRHLIIKVNDIWYKLSASRRQKLAAVWLEMWRDAMQNGIVSVLDAVSYEPVVNYSPSGSVSLTTKTGR